jgi:CheY-like chemotaxis protein
MAQMIKRFLLVDDDPINNYLSKIILKKSLEEVHITDFTVPEDALDFIKSGANDNPSGETITIFLDINMPTMSGWEFLEAFELFDLSIKEQYHIYILSSTINHNDINLARENCLVIDFLEKPLNQTILNKLFE